MKQPVRLNKKQYSLNDEIKMFMLNHALFFSLFFSFLAGGIFVILCYQLIGLSAVESGYLKNFIGEMI